ncbi:hypothetical protein Cs308_0723 [Candidatus Chlamydia sanziniae]|uniref:Uncharacterized protein n=1 Tax=Candidatus Chlamydia sanziniae TaxID=1806891 RepID=A0A1A9HXS4_9CHLA|nr:hypothetical protein Cs308_0723 [Candidatus Chlamydia sanziniae]
MQLTLHFQVETYTPPKIIVKFLLVLLQIRLFRLLLQCEFFPLLS